VEPALAAHHDLAHVPADVVELKRDDLAGAQAEPRQEQQDGEGATPTRRRAIASRDHVFDLLSREER
jgi:hypothetical protein